MQVEYATRPIPGGSNAGSLSYERHLERRSAAPHGGQARCEYCGAASRGRYPHPRGGSVTLCAGCAHQQAATGRRHKSAAYRTRLVKIKSALGIL
jgi:hypothetical protein